MYYVYILASRRHGTLYIGVTNSLRKRLEEHSDGRGSEFVKTYGVHRLVYVETYDRADEAIAREKQLRRWKPDWKIELIGGRVPSGAISAICWFSRPASNHALWLWVPALAGTTMGWVPHAILKVDRSIRGLHGADDSQPHRQPRHPPMSIATLWIPFTIIAALGQVARNAMQRQLTGPLGTWGATNIRFLFGFPFSILFFATVLAISGDHVPWPTAVFWPWLLLGALSQIVGTGLMLLAMNDRSFVVTTAYLKTEAIQTAIFGFVFLGDHLTLLKVIAILIATAGVVIAALRPGAEKGFADLKPTLMGLAAAAAFALSAVGFRGAVIVVPGVSFVTAASYTLVLGLFVQTLLLTIYLLARAPDVLGKILRLWKPSMFAGFVGAFASQFWFLAFALTAAANVRTLALVEVLFAQGVAYYSFKQPLSARELFGIALIVVGVALLVAV
jgi:predicted GIY-YIG superfamily endonuclease/drug/metabolite transporter (DMT)-like permease